MIALWIEIIKVSYNTLSYLIFDINIKLIRKLGENCSYLQCYCLKLKCPPELSVLTLVPLLVALFSEPCGLFRIGSSLAEVLQCVWGCQPLKVILTLSGSLVLFPALPWYEWPQHHTKPYPPWFELFYHRGLPWHGAVKLWAEAKLFFPWGDFVRQCKSHEAPGFEERMLRMRDMS